MHRVRIFFKDFETENPGYSHQENAWKRLSSTHLASSTLVATGTGSGKTECFVYPVLDHCARAKKLGLSCDDKLADSISYNVIDGEAWVWNHDNGTVPGLSSYRLYGDRFDIGAGVRQSGLDFKHRLGCKCGMYRHVGSPF